MQRVPAACPPCIPCIARATRALHDSHEHARRTQRRHGGQLSVGNSQGRCASASGTWQQLPACSAPARALHARQSHHDARQQNLSLIPNPYPYQCGWRWWPGGMRGARPRGWGTGSRRGSRWRTPARPPPHGSCTPQTRSAPPTCGPGLRVQGFLPRGCHTNSVAMVGRSHSAALPQRSWCGVQGALAGLTS